MTRTEDEDWELRAEAALARRQRAWARTCQCGDDLPGYCPGPTRCPYATPLEGETP